jgi:hypothetical protein
MNINEAICRKFYKKYKRLLSEFDGFVHSYPPAFSLLFERFDKPIITISCTRLDYPVYPNNYSWFIQGIKRLHKNNQLIPIANNLLDKFYCEKETDFEWEHISSLCNYMKSEYLVNSNKFVIWTRSKFRLSDERIDNEFSISKRYDRDQIHKYKGVIHIPYNLSIMSAFEHYKQNIPMFFPSPNFQEKLLKERTDILNEVLFPATNLKFENKLIRLADWYDQNNFKGVILYDNVMDLLQKLSNTDFVEVSNDMKLHNLVRETYIVSQWKRVMESIS